MTPITSAARSELAPSGTLRVGINYGNFLLVSFHNPDTGDLIGIAPDLARELGRRAEVPVKLVAYDAAGKMADAVRSDAWDVAFLGAEPARASEIAFAQAYLEIPSGYLVPAGSKLQSIDEVDREGIRVAAAAKSAYELYLSRSLKRATLVRTDGIEASFDAFVNDRLDALAGLKPGLLEALAKLPGARILDGQFTAVQQAIGTPGNRKAAAAFLSGYAEDVKASGLVASLIEKHGVRGVSVAPAASG